MMNNETTAAQLKEMIEAKMTKVQSRNESWAAKVLEEAILAGVSDAAIAAMVAEYLPGESLWLITGGRVIAQGTHEPILAGGAPCGKFTRVEA